MNMKFRTSCSWLSFFTITLLASACNKIQTNQSSELPPAANESVAVDPAVFLEDGLANEITEEACTLSGGTETTCYRITVTSIPTDHKAGPWCPGKITDSAEAGGIWPEDGVMNDVDGPFVENLDTFYSDDEWKLYEADGTIRVTGSAEQCAAAARPDVDEAYNNYCVQCLPDYVQEGMVSTILIPVEPIKQATPSQLTRGSIGVALNGVNFDPPAPTQAILSAHTIAPFDDCGGHINLNEGYHYHAHTGCPTEVPQADEHAPLIGYMLDGFPLHARLDKNGEATSDLDQCGGDYDEVRGYHYHVGEPGDNAIINCFQGEQGCTFEGNGEGQLCDATAISNQRGRPGGRPGDEPGNEPGGRPDSAGNGTNGVPPGFDEAATQLGVTVDELMAALGRPPFDLEAAAATLGVTVEDLSEALPAPPQQRPRQQPGPPPEQQLSPPAQG